MRDAIVVGAGVAGLTAARELRHLGLDVLVLEARERIGGRTWTVQASGHTLELGGTWVHWNQPHVWAELTRYGIGVAPSRTPARAVWILEGERRDASYAEFDELMRRAADALCAEARTWFPTPHDIGDTAKPVDSVSLREYIDGSGGDPEFRMLNEVFWGVNSSARCEEVSAASAFAWYAWAGFDAQRLAECAYTYKIEGGMSRLIDAIAADGSPDIRYGARVVGIEQTKSDVSVVLADGETLDARAVVVASPLNTWRAIDFVPELSDAKRVLITQGHAGHGVKVMIRVNGRHDLNVALPETNALTWVQPEYLDKNETIFVAFGPSGDALQPADEGAVAAALDAAIPGMEILEVIGHDWAGDDLSRGTWATYRPGQLTGLLPAARQPEGRVAFAGADVSRGWISLVDGGIESGLTAALTTRRTLDR